MIRKIFKMLNQCAVDNPTLPVNQRFSHLFEILAECQAVLWECRAATMGRQVFGTRMVYRETFLQIQLRLLQHLIRKSQIHGSIMYQNTRHRTWWAKAKHQLRIRSARNSVVPSEGGFSKNCGADQQRLQISDPPNFEVLDAKIASAMSRIIHNSKFKRKVSLEEQKAQKEDRFFRGRQIAYLIYEYFWVTGVNDSVENYADLFTVVLRNDDIQEFDSKWDGILLSMTKIPPVDILEGLYKLRIRESEKLKTVLELYNMEIHQKKAGPDYHRLKTMVKRNIEQNLRFKNFEARNGHYERNAVVKNQGTKQREQRILGDCWQWEFNGQCSRGDNCSFRHDINKRAKLTQLNTFWNSFMQQNERKASRTKSPRGRSPSGRMFRLPCKDYLKGTCTNSFCEKWHPPVCLFYKSENGCRFWEKCSYVHRQVEEQPSKRFKKNGDKSAVAMLKKNATCYECLLIKYTTIGLRISGLEPPKSSPILRKSSNIWKPIRCVQFTKAVVRHADIRNQNPSLGLICRGDLHQRNPGAPKFEGRSQEETE